MMMKMMKKKMNLPKIELLKEKIAHPGFRRYFKNTGWMFFGQGINLAAGFFVGAYIARYLGPSNFGLMNYVISFATIFSFLSGYGIDTIIKREFVAYPEKKEELIGTSFWLKLISSFAALVIINIASLLLNTGNEIKLLTFVFSFTYIFTSFNIITIYFQSQVIAKKSIKVQIVTAFISIIVKLLFIYLNLSLVWFIAIYVIDAINLAIGLVLAYKKTYKKSFKPIFVSSLAKSIFINSLPVTITYIFLMIYLKIDQIILKIMTGETVLGFYSAAVKISEIWYFIPALICTSLFPAIINAKKTDKKTYLKRLKNLYYLMFFLALAISIPIYFSSGLIIKILFGTAYLPAIGILKIYIWSSIPLFLITATTQYLISENYTKIYLYISIIGAVSNIILNIILIKLYGANGAAIATLISYSLILLSMLFFRKIRRDLKK